jgi:hypothetical protein
MSEDFRRGIDMGVSVPMPFNTRNMLSVNPQGATSVNETYVPQHDIINCVPGAFVGMCKLIQTIDTEASTKNLNISEKEMETAVLAVRYILSRQGLSHGTPEEAYLASGLVDLSWQARTWVLKNLGDVMIRMWHQIAIARVNNVKDYMDFPVNQAAEALLRSLGRGMD